MADREAPIHPAEPATAPPHDVAGAAAVTPRDGRQLGLARGIGTPGASAIAVVTTLIGLIVLAWAILFITKGRFLKHPFENIASRMSERQVRVAGDFQLYFAPFNVKFLAEGLTISNPQWAGPRNFFEVKRIDMQVATLSLLGKKRINHLWVDDGRLDLEWDAQRRRNTWTFGDPNKKGDPFEPPLIKVARIAGSEIRYRDPKMLLSADIKIEPIEARGTSLQNAIRFSGTGTARNTPFTMNGSLLSPNDTLAGGDNKLVLHLEGVRTIADITGTLPGATEIEGAKLNMDMRGRNLADIFSVAGIAVPDTRRYRLTSAVTKDGIDWRFTGMRGRFGESDLAGRMTVSLREPRLFIDADLRTRVIDIADAAPFIGYNPDLVAAGGARAAVSQAGGTPRLLPDAPLRVEALSNFDAHVDYTVSRVRARSFPISNIGLTLDLDNRLLKLSPLTFDMARGHVDSDISIDARRSPVFTDYDIRLSPTPMGVLLAGFGVEESGTSGTLKARIKMTGTGNSVRDSLAHSNGRIAIILPKGTFWTRNVQLSEIDIGTFVQKMFEDKLKEPVQINCGLIGFTVRDGIAAADPILIDTQKNVMVGRGGFSFKNESLDFAFRADSKKFSLFSAQSPVGINGYFAKPGIDVISPELIGRAGAGIGLAVVASPLAAVLAFVDVGDAKAASCGPILAGATAQAQRITKGKPRDDVGRGTTAKSESGKSSKSEKKSQRKKFLGIF